MNEKLDRTKLSLDYFAQKENLFSKEEILRLLELIPDEAIKVSWWVTDDHHVSTALERKILLDTLSPLADEDTVEAEYMNGYLTVG